MNGGGTGATSLRERWENLAREGAAASADDVLDLLTEALAERGERLPRPLREECLSHVDLLLPRAGRTGRRCAATHLAALDITPPRLAEEQAARQAERAQTASRLITMGEMASSVAHELNQPLTAISNYCNGMMSRIKSQSIDNDSFLVWWTVFLPSPILPMPKPLTVLTSSTVGWPWWFWAAWKAA